MKKTEWKAKDMMHIAEITFFSEGIRFRLDDEKADRKWILSVLQNEGRKPGEINYIFCSDEYLHTINLEYLDHDTLTDIVTFDMREEDSENISGDIFVSIDRVKDNASSINVDFQEELHRVMIHGILHLVGYNDKSEEEKLVMRAKENDCLNLLNNN